MRREKNRRQPDRWGPFVALALVLLIAQGLRVAFTSPLLQVREVVVVGKTRYDAAYVRERARIDTGANIFSFNTRRAAANLLKNPILAWARFRKELPGTLVVELRERQPAIQLALKEGTRVWQADAEGVVFQPSPQVRNDLPLLQLPAAKLPAPGKSLDPVSLRVVRQSREAAAEQQLVLRRTRVDSRGEVWFQIEKRPGRQGNPPETVNVRAGRPVQIAEKLRDVRNVLVGWPTLPRKMAYLNVMCAGRPAYRPVEVASATPQPTG